MTEIGGLHEERFGRTGKEVESKSERLGSRNGWCRWQLSVISVGRRNSRTSGVQ